MNITRTLALEPSAWLGRSRKTALVRESSANLPAAELPVFSIVTGTEQIDRLEPEWNGLCAKAEGPARLFLSFNWLWHWRRHYLGDGSTQLAVVAARHQGEVVLIWPLAVTRTLGLKTVSFAGAPVSQYGDILVDRTQPGHEAWIAGAWRHMTSALAPDIVHLRKVRAGSAAAVLMQRLGAKQANPQIAPCIGLAGLSSFEEFDERFSAKDRKNRRRRRKIMSEQGTAEFRRLSGSADAIAAFELAMQWKRRWLEDGALVSTAIADDRFDRFFASVLGETDRPAGAEVFELSMGGKPVSIKIAVTSGAYRGLHLTAYDRAHEKFSPGRLIVERVVEASLADGVTELDFLAPAYPYKLDWTENAVAIHDYSLPITMAGRLFDRIYLQGLRPHLRRLANNGPQSLRRLCAALLKARARR